MEANAKTGNLPGPSTQLDTSQAGAMFSELSFQPQTDQSCGGEEKKLVTASPETTVNKAAKPMARGRVGAVMVVDDHRLVGIFTQRDAVFRVIAPGLDSQTTRLAEVMASAPKTVDPDKSLG